jgi:hypothetical protein
MPGRSYDHKIKTETEDKQHTTAPNALVLLLLCTKEYYQQSLTTGFMLQQKSTCPPAEHRRGGHQKSSKGEEVIGWILGNCRRTIQVGHISRGFLCLPVFLHNELSCPSAYIANTKMCTRQEFNYLLFL